MILTVNTGSSSIRLAAYSEDLARVTTVRYELDRTKEPARLLEAFLNSAKMNVVDIVVHRVVRGGERRSAPCIIDPEVEKDIESAARFAPLHNPSALEWIRLCRQRFGSNVVHVAVFDTGFYRHMPAVASTYALPQQLNARTGLRRYGFHGLAHQAMWQRYKTLRADARYVISLQLGSGCSITAVRDGDPVDTSMGFTPLEGLIMATRAGDIDPGALLYLQQSEKLSAAQLEEVLSNQSGLLGVSGISGDMQTLLRSNQPSARLAIDLYCYRARKYIGAYMAALGRIDGILFGGGVGEHAAPVRERILDGLDTFGISLDRQTNETAVGIEQPIHRADSRVDVYVIPVDESQLLAREGRKLLSASK